MNVNFTVLSSDHVDREKLLEMALQNKSKRNPFTFREMVRQMSQGTEIDLLWEKLQNIIYEQFKQTYEKVNDPKCLSSNEFYLEIGPVIQAAIDIAQVTLNDSLPVPTAFLWTMIFLNDNLCTLPDSMDNLKNNISLLCEKMFYGNYIEDNELFTYNCLKYLLERSTRRKATKKDVKRVYALRSLFPKILALEKIKSCEFWPLFKKCVVSSLYLSMLEGQKVISHVLTLNVIHVYEIHEEVKKKLAHCTLAQATLYGKAYYEAWLHAFRTNSQRLKQELEFVCVKDFIEFAICERNQSRTSSARKILSEFHLKKKETAVLKMLYSYYHPILYRYLRHPDGLIRANAAQLFLDVFPLEDPDLDIVMSDMELNTQMLSIKELLIDEYPIVRQRAIVGLCLAMSLHYELFSEEMIKTYLDILVDELALDSSSVEVRCAVAKGFKGLLANPLTIPALKSILPKLKPLFDDTSNTVRIAFCQLLLSVKKVCGIRYYDIVPIRHLVARMEEDPAVAKLIVNLIHNSYFPKGERPTSWLLRCIEIIKLDNEASREFFRFVPRYIGVDSGAKFMVQVLKTLFYYVKSKSSNVSLNDSLDMLALEEAIDFNNTSLVKSIIDAIVVLWFSCNLTKPENKVQLKMVVANFSKWMEELLHYYEDTEVWSSIYYLASFLPPEYVPSLVDRCYKRLKSKDTKMDYKFYNVLLHCLCNLRESDRLLEILKEWIDFEFAETTERRKTPKRQKTEEIVLNKNPILGLQLLNDMLDYQPFQKITTVQHAGKLKNFLDLFDNLKIKTESFVQAKISNNQISFIAGLLFTMAKISCLLHDEENFDGIKEVETIVSWVDNKLCKIAGSEHFLTNITRRGSAISKEKCSSSFEKLVREISKDLCILLTDMTNLGFFNTKKNKFIKFGMKLLRLEPDPSTVLQVSKLFLRHIWYGVFRYYTEKQDDVLLIIPDCFKKIKHSISDLEKAGSTPSNVLKEIQFNITKSLKIMSRYNGSSVTLNKTLVVNESQISSNSQYFEVISTKMITDSSKQLF